jgi:tetratricopeptide (TPR) repeat protein
LARKGHLQLNGRLRKLEVELSRQQRAETAEQRRATAELLLEKAELLAEQDRLDEAVRCYEEIVALANRDDATDVDYLADALLERALLKYELDHSTEALAGFDEVLTVAAGHEAPALRAAVLHAQYNKAHLLRSLGLDGRAVEVYADLLNTFADHAPPDTDEWIAKAFLGSANIATDLNQPEAAIALYDELQRRYGDTDDLAVRATLMLALVAKARAVAFDEDYHGAVACCDEAIQFAEEPVQAELEVALATAMTHRAAWLDNAGNHRAATEAYREVIARFGTDDDPQIQARVRFARDGLRDNVV